MPYAHIVTARRRIPVPRQQHMRAAKLSCDRLARDGPARIELWPTGCQVYVGKADRRHYHDPPRPDLYDAKREPP